MSILANILVDAVLYSKRTDYDPPEYLHVCIGLSTTLVSLLFINVIPIKLISNY